MGKVLSPEELAEIRKRTQKHLRGEIWRDDIENLLETIDAYAAVVTAAEKATVFLGWQKDIELGNKLLSPVLELVNALVDLKRKQEAPDVLREMILLEVSLERSKQDAQWGGPEHDRQHTGHDWRSFIELHASKAVVGPSSMFTFRQEMLKVAALAVAAIEWADYWLTYQPTPTAVTGDEDAPADLKGDKEGQNG